MGPITDRTTGFKIERPTGNAGELYPMASREATYHTATVVGDRVFIIKKLLTFGLDEVAPNCCYLDTKRWKWVWLGISGPTFYLHEALLVDDAIVVFGKDELPGAGTGHLWRLDLTTVEWNCLDMQPIPVRPLFMVCEFIEETRTVVFYGGEEIDGVDNVLLLIDLNTLSWIFPREKGSRPSARRGHTSCMRSTRSDSMMFVFGGRNGGNYYNDLYTLHIRKLACSWSNIAIGMHIPPVAFGSLAIVNNTLFIYGGFDNELDDVSTFVSYDLGDKECYDIQKGEKFQISASGNFSRAWLGANSANRLLPFHDGLLIVGGFACQYPWVDILHAVE